jgi:hypothetical protein
VRILGQAHDSEGVAQHEPDDLPGHLRRALILPREWPLRRRHSQEPVWEALIASVRIPQDGRLHVREVQKCHT